MEYVNYILGPPIVLGDDYVAECTVMPLKETSSLSDPSPWPELLPELWELIFDKGKDVDFQGLQSTSKWAHQLFWDYRSECNIIDPTCKDEKILRIVGQCNPRRVKHINLGDTMATDKALLDMPSLRWLKYLSLERTSVTDHGLSVIGERFPCLEQLSLRCCSITDEGLGHLTGLQRLQILLLENCRKLTEVAHLHLAQLLKLKHLTLSSSQVHLLALDRGQGVQVHSPDLPELRQKLGNGNFGGFHGLSNLETLDSGPFMALTPAAVSIIAQLRSLRHLRVQQSQLLDQGSIEAISRMTQLVELHIYKCQFVASFTALGGLSLVRSLNLRGCFIKDVDLPALATISSLERLNLSECHKITDRGLHAFLDLCIETRLKWLMMYDCRRLAFSYASPGWRILVRTEYGVELALEKVAFSE